MMEKNTILGVEDQAMKLFLLAFTTVSIFSLSAPARAVVYSSNLSFKVTNERVSGENFAPATVEVLSAPVGRSEEVARDLIRRRRCKPRPTARVVLRRWRRASVAVNIISVAPHLSGAAGMQDECEPEPSPEC